MLTELRFIVECVGWLTIIGLPACFVWMLVQARRHGRPWGGDDWRGE